MAETNADVATEPTADMAGKDGRNTDTGSADLLDEHDREKPQRGQMLQGKVLEVHDEAVIVDVGLKRNAFVPRNDLDQLDEAALGRLEPGAEVEVYVLRPQNTGGDLIVSINKALGHEDWDRANALLHSGQVVEAEVSGTNRGGVEVRFGQLRGFVPQSHLTSMPRGSSEEERRQAKERLVGQTLNLKVIEAEPQQDRLVMSERMANRESRKARLEELEAGQVLVGQVVSLTDYGAFVDVGGVDGLVHVSELAWRRVGHPRDVLSVGDEVEVQVKSVDLERERISLSRRAVLPNPWDMVEIDYPAGTLATGTVTNVVDFGAFVTLPSGLEGLVHVSQMSSHGGSQPGDLVRRGDEVLVRIMGVDRDRERISLSLDAVSAEEQAEWQAARAEEESMSAGPDEQAIQNEPDPDPQPDATPIDGDDCHVEDR